MGWKFGPQMGKGLDLWQQT